MNSRRCFPVFLIRRQFYSKKLNGTNDNVKTPKVKRKRSEAKIDTPAVLMGIGDIESDLIAVQPLKWLYVSMLHPETTEDSIVKLLSKKLNKAENDFTCVKLVPKNIPTLTESPRWECQKSYLRRASIP
jgi:hypothetical protein